MALRTTTIAGVVVVGAGGVVGTTGTLVGRTLTAVGGSPTTLPGEVVAAPGAGRVLVPGFGVDDVGGTVVGGGVISGLNGSRPTSPLNVRIAAVAFAVAAEEAPGVVGAACV